MLHGLCLGRKPEQETFCVFPYEVVSAGAMKGTSCVLRARSFAMRGSSCVHSSRVFRNRWLQVALCWLHGPRP